MITQQALPPLMLVDDDQNDALLLARRLKQGGVPNPLLHFRNGGDAFMFLKPFCVGEKPREQRPCLIFLDVNMPNLSGFDVLAWARQQPELRDIRIIMVSGAGEAWDAEISAKLGADDYLKKFPSADDLADLVASQLAASHIDRVSTPPVPSTSSKTPS